MNLIMLLDIGIDIGIDRGIVYNLIFHWKGIIKFRFCEHQISSLAKNANLSLDTVIPL